MSEAMNHMIEDGIMDEFGTLINGDKTYAMLGDVIRGTTEEESAGAVFAWSDERGTQYDFIMTQGPSYQPDNSKLLQGGVSPESDLFVSIMRIGAFSFDITAESKTNGNYVAEKLGLSVGSTADKVAELINGIIKDFKDNATHCIHETEVYSHEYEKE